MAQRLVVRSRGEQVGVEGLSCMHMHDEPRAFKLLTESIQDIVLLDFEKQGGKRGKAKISLRRLREALKDLIKENKLFRRTGAFFFLSFLITVPVAWFLGCSFYFVQKHTDGNKFMEEVEHCEVLEPEGVEAEAAFPRPSDVPDSVWELASARFQEVLRALTWDDGVAENETTAIDADPVAPSGAKLVGNICTRKNLELPKDAVVVDLLKLGNYNIDCKAFPTLLSDGERGMRSLEEKGLSPCTVHDYL